MTYLAAVPNATQTTVTGLQWFKVRIATCVDAYGSEVRPQIYEDGLTSDGKWGVQRMIANKGKVSFTIPACIKSGDVRYSPIPPRRPRLNARTVLPPARAHRPPRYAHHRVLTEVIADSRCANSRFELPRRAALCAPDLARSRRPALTSPQMECAQIRVSGGGSASPATVSFPGAYKGADPGITYNLYSGRASPAPSSPSAAADRVAETTYTIPGPAPFSCSGSGASTTATTSKPTSSTASSSATTKTTSTTASSTSSAPQATQTKFGQCGGTGYS